MYIHTYCTSYRKIYFDNCYFIYKKKSTVLKKDTFESEKRHYIFRSHVFLIAYTGLSTFTEKSPKFAPRSYITISKRLTRLPKFGDTRGDVVIYPITCWHNGFVYISPRISGNARDPRAKIKDEQRALKSFIRSPLTFGDVI